jgi:hypothetical protein
MGSARDGIVGSTTPGRPASRSCSRAAFSRRTVFSCPTRGSNRRATPACKRPSRAIG